jgi:hypothetical protein
MNRRRLFWWLASPLLVSGTVIGAACSSQPVSQAPQVLPPPTVTAAPTAPASTAVDAAPVTVDAGCNLTARGIDFPDASCHQCMQASCCEVTSTCFGSAGCAALYSCINGCPSRGLPAADGAVFSDAGDGGDPCVPNCEAQHPIDTPAARAFIQCYAQSCVSLCR